MSHVASVKAYVTDLEILDKVAGDLGLELVRNVDTYAWFGRWVGDYSGGVAAVSNGHDPKTFGTCQHKLRRKDHQPGDYEIGLVPRLDGGPGWELLYDNWGSGGARIEQLAGKNLGALKNEISAAVSARILARKGYRVSRTVDANGVIKITGRL